MDKLYWFDAPFDGAVFSPYVSSDMTLITEPPWPSINISSHPPPQLKIRTEVTICSVELKEDYTHIPFRI
ncbi:unnamed protein product [Leptosia nina]|uniref:Uncharacterized protein n=1 Tax=Leptosia nina TaxID=320188 RepID=A0AAV1JAK1_9NEOP